jgi:hypothetical protein
LALGPEIVEQIHRRVVEIAHVRRIIRGRRLRMDTTVVETDITYDYKRHGTATLLAALNVPNGTVLTECKAWHPHQEFLAFLHRMTGVPPRLDVHLIVQNYSTHKRPRVNAWLRSSAPSR